MKLAGREIKGPNTETVVFPRGDGPSIVITAQAIMDYTPFEKLCPMPRPPAVIRRGGERSLDVEDPRFVQAMFEHNQRRSAWMILTSIRLGTPDLEWETVKYNEPNTWPGYVEELRDAGFSEGEIVRVVRAVMIANALDDAKLDAARADFLRSREARADRSSFPAAEQSSTPSGEPVSDSV